MGFSRQEYWSGMPLPSPIEKLENSKKNIYFIDYTEAFDSVDHSKLWKILKDMGIQATLPAS